MDSDVLTVGHVVVVGQSSLEVVGLNWEIHNCDSGSVRSVVAEGFVVSSLERKRTVPNAHSRSVKVDF